MLHFDDLTLRDVGVFGAGPQTLFSTSGYVGAHWLRSRDGTREHAIFAFDGALASRFRAWDATAELALAGGRDAEPTPLSQRPVDRLRLEGRAALAVPGHGFFWQLTAGGRWQRDLDGELPTVSGTVLGTAGWLRVTKGVDAGLAHRSATGWLLDLDGWSRAPDWQHEIGLFVRLRGGRRGAERYSAGPAGFSWW